MIYTQVVPASHLTPACHPPCPPRSWPFPRTTQWPWGGDQVILTDSVFVGEDGSEAGLDAKRTYRLDFTGITPHPVQGFHVKLTVDAEGSQGANTKHKVFWVTGCNGYPGYPSAAQ